MENKNKTILTVEQVAKKFGGIQALDNLSFELERGTITSLIGPNGAGKTTFVNVVTGIHSCDSGKILFEGENISELSGHLVPAKGIGRTFQLQALFGSLSVLENTMVGCHTRTSSGMLACGFSLPSARKEARRITSEAMNSLKLVGLEEKADDPISKLPLGERKLVDVARALSIQPSLLMLDEPAGGLAEHEIARLVDLIRLLITQGITILIIEHNMPFVMSLSEKVIVIDEGSKISEGPPELVKSDHKVIEAYLGEDV